MQIGSCCESYAQGVMHGRAKLMVGHALDRDLECLGLEYIEKLE